MPTRPRQKMHSKLPHPPPLSALCLFLHLNRCVRAGLQVSRIGGMPLDFVWLLACFIAIERAWTALDLAPLKNMENNSPVTMVESNQPALGFNILLGRQTHTHTNKKTGLRGCKSTEQVEPRSSTRRPPCKPDGCETLLHASVKQL